MNDQYCSPYRYTPFQLNLVYHCKHFICHKLYHLGFQDNLHIVW